MKIKQTCFEIALTKNQPRDGASDNNTIVGSGLADGSTRRSSNLVFSICMYWTLLFWFVDSLVFELCLELVMDHLCFNSYNKYFFLYFILTTFKTLQFFLYFCLHNLQNFIIKDKKKKIQKFIMMENPSFSQLYLSSL